TLLDCAKGLVLKPPPVAATGALVTEGAEFSGAPTGISQRCPGCPCSGFKPEAELAATVFASPRVLTIAESTVNESLDVTAFSLAVVLVVWSLEQAVRSNPDARKIFK